MLAHFCAPSAVHGEGFALSCDSTPPPTGHRVGYTTERALIESPLGKESACCLLAAAVAEGKYVDLGKLLPIGLQQAFK